MAGEDDEVIVALSGDTSTTDVKVVEVGKNGATVVDFNNGDGDGEDPVADLKKQFGQISGQLRTVVTKQQQTEQQLQDTTQRLHRAESQVVVSQIDTVESGIAQVQAEAVQAEADYARAFEAGDGPAMARAQRVMMRAETNLAKLTEAKQDLQEAAKRGPVQQQARQQAQPAADPVERVASTLSPRSAAWIRSHPDCITDPKMNARMMAAHNLAIAEDIPLDSDEYFERIEKGIKPVKQQEVQSQQKTNGDGRRPSSGAASAAGSSGGMNGGATTVKLTAREAAAATDGSLVWNFDSPDGKHKKGEPLGLAEYARRKHEGMKAGLYNPNNIEA